MRNFKILLLLLASAIILSLFFYFQNIITYKDKIYKQLYEITSRMQMQYDFYAFNFELNSKMNGLTASDVLYMETKNDKKDRYLSDLVCKKPLLIYRYADVNCNTCYEAEIKVLQQEFSDYPQLIAILCSYKVDQEFIVFKKINQIQLPLYRISSDAFNWTVEDYGNPYCFVLHPDMKISHVYVPNKSYPELNKQYLEGVKRFLTE